MPWSLVWALSMLLSLCASVVRADPPDTPPAGEAATAATPAFFWSGTAPFCEASANDCTANGFYSWGQSAAGDGGACVTGWKYLCASLPITQFGVTVVGTAPFCDASCSDCPQGYSCWTTTNSGISDAGGGGVCASGEKWICIKPATTRSPR